jgi:hypothetical protein
VLSSYVSTFIYLRVATRLTKAPLTSLLPLPEIARTLASAGLGFLAAWLLGEPSSHKFVNLVTHGAVFSLVFFIAGLACGLFTQQDKRMARRMAERLRLMRPA